MSFFSKKPPAHEAPVSTQASESPTQGQAWFSQLKAGLRKTALGLSSVFVGTRVDDAWYEELENALLMADTGVAATRYLLDDLKRKAKEASAHQPEVLRNLLVDSVASLLQSLQKPLVLGRQRPTVIMIAGINGAGKTTSIGKLSHYLARQGHSVLLAAADTFRAAARDQLAVWAQRSTVEMVSSSSNDPAAVSYDAVLAGKARGKDVVLIDTAGRLPTQLHLMEELKKIKRVVQKADESAHAAEGASAAPVGATCAPHEVLLVLDGTTGQNALAQVRAFDDALGLTGLIVTKLDGTAKGGILAAIARERPIPVYFIGVGEGVDAWQIFDARAFAQALLS